MADSTNAVNEGRNHKRRDPKSCCAHYVAAALAVVTPINGVCRITRRISLSAHCVTAALAVATPFYGDSRTSHNKTILYSLIKLDTRLFFLYL